MKEDCNIKINNKKLNKNRFNKRNQIEHRYIIIIISNKIISLINRLKRMMKLF